MRLETAGALLRDVRRQLATADIPTADLDARLLVTHALGMEALQLIVEPGRAVSPDAAGRAADFVARRLRGEPVSRLLGSRELSRPFVRITAVSRPTELRLPRHSLVQKGLLDIRMLLSSATRVMCGHHRICP